ncbi:16S rRNA (cytosine(1402)-N(4))-methyltransferase RsmH [Methyloterricola oryzae]|uniref:16S rRNA (cytosine(1402)-N(4))-methyltransferase RsmH n=1 Tax=Methyloterricola oryzae TaxID=1495050 RepID=UPI0005EBC8AC|nr:16S rRNA (cytosine(1402)-N(4))-methyltransferase RsmH [Methyloterricola oryzae]
MSVEKGAHVPVMLAEALEGLNIQGDGFYVDCTFGRGGHSAAILARLGPAGRLLALDKDPAAVAWAKEQGLLADERFAVWHGSFAELVPQIDKLGKTGDVGGILMDLGVSSPQLDEAERGFSFMREGPLDMRMDTSRGPTAAEWIDAVTESELERVLRTYGEERFARRIARAILAARPLTSTSALARVIEQAVPTREKGKHPATRSFQAIRIALNGELEALEQALEQAVKVLRPGGRLVVIAFHSLEDRIVKRFMRDQERGRPLPAHLPVPIEHRARLRRVGKKRLPSADEVQANVRARSAVMRVAERVAA